MLPFILQLIHPLIGIRSEIDLRFFHLYRINCYDLVYHFLLFVVIDFFFNFHSLSFHAAIQLNLLSDTARIAPPQPMVMKWSHLKNLHLLPPVLPTNFLS